MAITRVIYATVQMSCCRDGDEIYKPLPRQIAAPLTKNVFTDTLQEWAIKAERALYEKYHEIAKQECEGMGATPSVCNFYLTVDNIEERGKPTMPVTVYDYIRTVEGYIKESKDNIKDYENQIADLYIKPLTNWTDKDKQKLKKLDNKIRKEKEFIREYENEIKKLKEQYEVK